jgi:hypothetical protein
MNVHLTQLGDRYDAESMRQRTQQIERAFLRVLSTEEASPFAMLISPDQSVWRVTVDNAGALHTAKMAKGQPV